MRQMKLSFLCLDKLFLPLKKTEFLKKQDDDDDDGDGEDDDDDDDRDANGTFNKNETN